MITHNELVSRTAQWCIKQGYFPVCTEFYYANIFDVIAFEYNRYLGCKSSKQYLIRIYNFEIKVSRKDYFAEKNKRSYEHPELCKAYKVFVTPKGLIDERELFPNCGLLEYKNGRFYKTNFWSFDMFVNIFELNKNFDFLFRAMKNAFENRKEIRPVYNWYEIDEFIGY